MFNKTYFRIFAITVIIIFIALLLIFTFQSDMQLFNNTEELLSNSANKTDVNLLIESSLIRVVDGDTIVVNIDGDSIKVRLIGIDAPESVNSDDSKNSVYGEEASEYLKNLLYKGQILYLEKDISDTDIYGRSLYYVWLSDDISDYENMLNYKILLDGYAIAKEYKPDIKYAEIFEEIYLDSLENSRGIVWKL